MHGAEFCLKLCWLKQDLSKELMRCGIDLEGVVPRIDIRGETPRSELSVDCAQHDSSADIHPRLWSCF